MDDRNGDPHKDDGRRDSGPFHNGVTRRQQGTDRKGHVQQTKDKVVRQQRKRADRTGPDDQPGWLAGSRQSRAARHNNLALREEEGVAQAG